MLSCLGFLCSQFTSQTECAVTMGEESAEPRLVLTEMSCHRVIEGARRTLVQPLSESRIGTEFEML